jgi:hypothetical protein
VVAVSLIKDLLLVVTQRRLPGMGNIINSYCSSNRLHGFDLASGRQFLAAADHESAAAITEGTWAPCDPEALRVRYGLSGDQPKSVDLLYPLQRFPDATPLLRGHGRSNARLP